MPYPDKAFLSGKQVLQHMRSDKGVPRLARGVLGVDDACGVHRVAGRHAAGVGRRGSAPPGRRRRSSGSESGRQSDLRRLSQRPEQVVGHRIRCHPGPGRSLMRRRTERDVGARRQEGFAPVRCRLPECLAPSEPLIIGWCRSSRALSIERPWHTPGRAARLLTA